MLDALQKQTEWILTKIRAVLEYDASAILPQVLIFFVPLPIPNLQMGVTDLVEFCLTHIAKEHRAIAAGVHLFWRVLFDG